jgi:putative endonuclease
MPYFCYIVECADGTFYTGLSTDPQRREKQHNKGSGARYTRQRRPVHLVFIEPQPDQRSAMQRERALKKLSHAKKLALVLSAQQDGLINEKQPI